MEVIYWINIGYQMMSSCSKCISCYCSLFIISDVIFAGSIMRLKSRLSDLIEPDFGLLVELLRLDVLTHREYDDVCSNETATHRTEAILDLLTSADQCDKFLKALQRTDQQHVVNYIIENGGQR